MAYITFQPKDYFNTVLWTGNSGSQTITGVGFQPDFLWTKIRSSPDHHQLRDAVRGINKVVRSASTAAEYTVTSAGAFNSDGFTTTGTDGGEWNYSGSTYASWNWLADNTSGSSNTDGTITSTVSANTTSGFSIVTYTGTGSNATIGHGLGTTPKMIIFKMRTGGTLGWYCYNSNLGATNHVVLNDTAASSSSSILFNDTEPTSSVMSVGTSAGTNQSGATYVAYCFAEKKGFSKFGSYTGNGSSDGTFIYLGFKPAFVIVKRTDTADGWQMFDNKRDIDNVIEARLEADSSGAEYTLVDWCDFLSNGIKMRYTGGGVNASGGSYIYMAFAEFPTVSSTGTPVTAR